ncbi:MAG: AEC family transporter [Alphaproteobacteria bacterium]|nr:AEC family transporter [Alphaproteobacteria bacterium]
MQPVFDVVLPVFGIIFAGYMSGRVRLLGADSSEALNKFCYWFALPAVLFMGPARVPLAQVFDLPYIGTFVGGFAISWLVGLAGLTIFFRAGTAQTALALLAATFANVGYMGIPLFLAAFGPANSLPAILGTSIYSLTLVAATVVLVESGLAGQGGARHALVNVAKGLAKSPLVVSPLLGLAWNLTGVPLPKPVVNFGELLGAAAGPCALFAIGLFLSGRSLGTLAGGRKSAEVGWLVFVKLIVQPLVTWWLAGVFGLDPFLTAAAVILASLPSAALCFVLAQQYKLYVERASAAILVSTVLSVVTISFLMIRFGSVKLPH